MPRSPEWLPRVLFESALIVFSVLLALALDEWRQDRARAERTSTALAAVRAEIIENRRAVEAAHAFHRAVHDTLSAYAERDELPPYRIYAGRGMFNPARVLSTAWESARESGANNDLPYDLVLTLGRTHAWQARYTGLGDRIVDGIYGDIRQHGFEPVLRDGYRGFISLTEDFANREDTLLESYDSALATLDRNVSH